HVRDLDAWGYLIYYPTYHPSRGSKIKMTRACIKSGTTIGIQEDQNLDNTVPEPRQNLVSFYKHKTNENYNKLARPKNELEVLSFFKTNNWSAVEGKKFYAYYKNKDWTLSRGLKITNWQETAKNFVEKGFIIKAKYTSPFSDYEDNLRKYDNRDKDYDMPL
ncbi:hypothetical protein EV196_1151, partial [Mariniflexile fucanivorans]